MHADIGIVGGGLIGLVTTLALAREMPKTRIILVAAKPQRTDRRTTAMLMPAVHLLRDYMDCEDLFAASAALRTMRIIDVSDRIVRAPAVEFNSAEIAEDAFGFNVPNALAAQLLLETLSTIDTVEVVTANAAAFDGEVIALETPSSDGPTHLEASLFVAADGKDSVLRDGVGIGTRSWSYPQTALVTTFAHTFPHGGVSTELHMESGPFTQVPLPGAGESLHRSSLVWVVEPGDADEMLDWDNELVSRQIEKRLQSSLGVVEVEEPFQAFPLVAMTAHRLAQNRLILVGEAAHVIPPIAAQGFNLGVSDIKTLLDLMLPFSHASERGDAEHGLTKQSAAEVARRYHRSRIAEIATKTGGVDMLNRSLLSGFLPLQLVRAAALGVFSQSSSLRQVVMGGIMNGPASVFRSTAPQEPG